MRGAIMQPYFFPYIGYYQLVYEVEKFLFLDDVTFIKQGYINRNSILLNGRRHDFSIPVSKISSYKLIKDHEYLDDKSKFLKLIEQAYKKYSLFSEVMPVIESVVKDEDNNVSKKNAKSITAVFEYLKIKRDFSYTSCINNQEKLKGQDKIISLCEKLKINKYRNSIGGQSLYSQDFFNSQGIELKFIKSNVKNYPQENNNFISNLSMIDVLMHCSKKEIINMLGMYELVD